MVSRGAFAWLHEPLGIVLPGRGAPGDFGTSIHDQRRSAHLASGPARGAHITQAIGRRGRRRPEVEVPRWAESSVPFRGGAVVASWVVGLPPRAVDGRLRAVMGSRRRVLRARDRPSSAIGRRPQRTHLARSMSPRTRIGGGAAATLASVDGSSRHSSCIGSLYRSLAGVGARRAHQGGVEVGASMTHAALCSFLGEGPRHRASCPV